MTHSTDHDHNQTYQVPEPDDKLPESPPQLRGLTVAAQAVGLADHKRMLDMHAVNLERSWRMSARANGLEDIVKETTTNPPYGGDDEMAGNVTVSGDSHNHYHVVQEHPANQEPAPAPSQPPPVAAQQPAIAKSNGMLPWLLATGLVASNIGGGAYLLNNLPRANDTDTTERTTISLTTGDE